MTNATEPLPLTDAPDAPSGDDPRLHLARAVALASAVIGRVEPDHLALTTPCDGMDVRLLLGHLVMALRRAACAARGDAFEEWPQEVTGLADDAWLPAWQQAAHEVQAAWTDPALLDEVLALPWDTMPGRAVVAIYTSEITVHTWDLARATGQDPVWDDGVVAYSLDAMQAALPADREPLWAEARAALPDGEPWEDPFANAVPVPDDAPLIDRLVAWTGRRP